MYKFVECGACAQCPLVPAALLKVELKLIFIVGVHLLLFFLWCWRLCYMVWSTEAAYSITMIIFLHRVLIAKNHVYIHFRRMPIISLEYQSLFWIWLYVFEKISFVYLCLDRNQQTCSHVLQFCLPACILSQRIIGPANVAYEQEVQQIPQWWLGGHSSSIPHVGDAAFLASTSAAMRWRVGAREIATTRPINVIVI